MGVYVLLMLMGYMSGLQAAEIPECDYHSCEDIF